MNRYFERQMARAEEQQQLLWDKYNPKYERYTWQEIIAAEDDHKYLEILAQQMRG